MHEQPMRQSTCALFCVAHTRARQRPYCCLTGCLGWNPVLQEEPPACSELSKRACTFPDEAAGAAITAATVPAAGGSSCCSRYSRLGGP